ncbi:pyrroline-5-carboxylate reductase [Candidatus Woesearchaeota archaeon]|nr:pyrroline-5-carboxylate reductase [Candidatus Woesearchaeota archaeon]
MMKRIGFIGSGNMAFALAKSIKKAKLASSIISSDISTERLDFMRKELKVKTTKDNKEVIDRSDIIFLAVKPQAIDEVLQEIKDTSKLIISIAAGVKLKKLETALKKAKVVRVMPNTPCLAGEMAAGFSAGKKVSREDITLVEEILNSAGKAYCIKEEQLDAVTGLSGSGPAFVARMIEWMAEGGVKAGLDRDTASKLTLQTFLGTAKLLIESGMKPEELVRIVSSPGGTTVAGREILEGSDVKETIIRTVRRAAERSRELGKG